MSTIKLTIDDQEIEVPEGYTILQACERAAIEVPVFCYHPNLSIAGNCRMCLVEVDRCPKPVASCAMPVAPGMVVRTKTPMVRKARKGVLEFLLINHPLDCPICDQGGECDLQDITMAYGPDASRFKENKRAVEDKDLGPLIKTVMNRCIHCTRCIRFTDEIAGTNELGAIHRGEEMEITTALQKSVRTELSGNLVDICPVGALTSKPYAFKARPWDLKMTQSVDVLDAMGSAIRIDSYGNVVMRIVPMTNDAINEAWINDKSRFACDGLVHQRLDRPYKREGGRLVPCSWAEALAAVAGRLNEAKGAEIAALIGPLADGESIMALRDIWESLNAFTLECRLDGEYTPVAHRWQYLFNTSIQGIEACDALLMVGTDLRREAPLLQTRWLKRWRNQGLVAGLVGEPADLSFPYENLGASASVLGQILEGDHGFATKLRHARNPMLVLGMGAMQREDSELLYTLCYEIARKYGMIARDRINFNLLSLGASRVGALDLGCHGGSAHSRVSRIYDDVRSGAIKVLYLLGADVLPLRRSDLGDTFVVYQGHHGDVGAHLADVILPGSAYTEKDGTYVNMEGRVQRAYKAVWAPGDAKEDWRILKALSQRLPVSLPYDTLDEIRSRMEVVAPTFAQSFGNFEDRYDVAVLKKAMVGPKNTPQDNGSKASPFSGKPLGTCIKDFYMTDVISRHSPTMAACAEAFGASHAPSQGGEGHHDGR